MPDIDLARFRGNALAEILLKFPCPQKVLMVTDGFLDFGTGGFGLSEFVGVVRAGGHTVATARRNGGGSATIPGNFNFASTATPVTPANYDQVWVFGFSTDAITASEQNTIAQFMQNGGGVFATGDHETIGAGMGSRIPRVNAMRNWSGIPMFDPERHDTVIHPGADGIKQFDDQADPVAQAMYPVFFSNGGPANVASSWSVHPVLRHPAGAVDCLPDHAHESECLAPVPAAGNFAGVEQWPAPVAGGARIAPVVVGVTVSAGRFITDTTKPPVRPHSFGAISAYDGDAAHVGRIVCDATWHHFVNINLNGTGGTPDTTLAARTGLYVAGAATPEYQKVQRYYLNTVRWLAPRNRRSCWPFLQVALARFDFEMLEVQQLPHPHPCPWDPLQAIGRIAEDVVTRHWGPGAMDEIVDGLLAAGGGSPALARMLQPQHGQGKQRDEPSLLPLQDLRRAVLASMVNVIADRLPADEEKLADILGDGHDEVAAKVLPEGVRHADLAIHGFLERALKQTRDLAKTLQASTSVK